MPNNADRVKETTSTSGTGPVTLSGAVRGYQAFASALVSGAVLDYCIVDGTSGDWETGTGTFTSGQLSRDRVYASSNSGALVTFATSAKEVFLTFAASEQDMDASENAVSAQRTIIVYDKRTKMFFSTLVLDGMIVLEGTAMLAGIG